MDLTPGQGAPAAGSVREVCQRDQAKTLFLQVLTDDEDPVFLLGILDLRGDEAVRSRKGDHASIRQPLKTADTRGSICHLLYIS